MDAYQSAKEEIKIAADIVELVGQFVQLKRTGQNHIGLCPFHSEKDPSFTVSPARQMFHCFGCKKGGDIFAFWMEYHRVSFPQALKDLAERYQIPLPQKRLTPSERERMEAKESLFKMNEIAAQYYHGILTKSEKGSPGREYLHKRSISKEIISEFRLGYAPDAWDGLTGYLKSKGTDLEKAVQAGLLIPRKNGGFYDRFRGRVLFPIFNLKGQIVGFGGRVLDDTLPKYLNTPETPVFHKGELLYGLHASRIPIRESGRAVVVEGYTDVLALRKHGFHESVATLGTALTRDHIRRLKGYAREAVIVFDSDEAGKLAALKSLSFFLDEGMKSRVMVLPDDDDPDSFVNRNGLERFLEFLKKATPMFDFYLHHQLAGAEDEVESQVSTLKEIIPILSGLKSDAQRSLYAQRLSEKMGIRETVVLAELKNWLRTRRWKEGESDLKEKLTTSRNRDLEHIDDHYMLNLLIHHPDTLERLTQNECVILLSDPTVIEIFNFMVKIHKREGKVSPAEILEILEEESVKERLREAMLVPPIFPDEMVSQVLNGFEHRVHKIRMAQSKIKAKKEGDLESLNKILELKRKNQGLVV